MKLADQMLLAQIREKLLGHIDDGQWRMIETEVENAGGVKETKGYAGTVLKDAIVKASFGGDRSAAGRYAAEQRWKGHAKQDKGTVGSDYASQVVAGILGNTFHQRSAESSGKGGKRWAGASEEKLEEIFYRRTDGPDGPGMTQEEFDLFRERGWLTPEGKVNPEIIANGGKIVPYPIPANAVFDDKNAFDEDMATQAERQTNRGTVPSSSETPKKAKETVSPEVAQKIKDSDLSGLARMIVRDLRGQGKEIPFGAEPYLEAMATMGDIGEDYFADSGTSIVAYALANLGTYKGANARAIKAELNRRLKAERDRPESPEEPSERNPNLPPLYQDYGDEPGDNERAVAGLRAMTTPLDLKNPRASERKRDRKRSR